MSNVDSKGLPTDPTRRKSGVMTIEVVNCMPNGDPDNGGGPRLDTQQRLLISDLSIKRMMKDYAERELDQQLHLARGADVEKQLAKYQNTDDLVLRNYDVRVFGGFLPDRTEGNRVLGPFQLSTARSVHFPVPVRTVGNTFVVHRTKKEQSEDGEEGDEKKRANMGSREVVDYALCTAYFSFLPQRAKANRMTPEDVAVLNQLMTESWDDNRSSIRTGVNLRRLTIFDHPGSRSVVPEHTLWNSVRFNRLPHPETRVGEEPAGYEDFKITVDTSCTAKGVDVYDWIDGTVSVTSGQPGQH